MHRVRPARLGPFSTKEMAPGAPNGAPSVLTRHSTALTDDAAGATTALSAGAREIGRWREAVGGVWAPCRPCRGRVGSDGSVK